MRSPSAQFDTPVGTDSVRLLDRDSPRVEWPGLASGATQFDDYHQHRRLPDTDTELAETPEPNGTLSGGPDRRDRHG